jgi:hypothetical protein
MRYSDHAREQMDERGATFDEVEETVAAPFATRPGHSGRVNYFKSIGGYAIRVTVFTDRRGVRHVITVWKEPLP